MPYLLTKEIFHVERRAEAQGEKLTSDSIPPILSNCAYGFTIIVAVGIIVFYTYSYIKFFRGFNQEYRLATKMNHHFNNQQQSSNDNFKMSKHNIESITTITDNTAFYEEISTSIVEEDSGKIPKLEESYGDKLKNFFIFKSTLINERFGLNPKKKQQLASPDTNEIKEVNPTIVEKDKSSSEINYFMIKTLKDKNDKLQSIDSVLFPTPNDSSTILNINEGKGQDCHKEQ